MSSPTETSSKAEGRFQSNTLTFEPSFNPTAKATRNHRGRRRHILKVLFDAKLIQVGSLLSMKYLDTTQGVRKKVLARVTPTGELHTDDGQHFSSASSFIMHYKKQPTHSHCIKVEGTNKSLTDLLKECEGKKGLLFSEYGAKIDMPACGKRKQGELSELASAAAAATNSGPSDSSDESGSEAAGSASDDEGHARATALSPEGSPALSARPEAPIGSSLPTLPSAPTPLQQLQELIARREIPLHLILEDFHVIHRQQQLLRGARDAPAPTLSPSRAAEQLPRLTDALSQPGKHIKFSAYSPTKKPRAQDSPFDPLTPVAVAGTRPRSPPTGALDADVHAKLDLVNNKIDQLWCMVERVLPNISTGDSHRVLPQARVDTQNYKA